MPSANELTNKLLLAIPERFPGSKVWRINVTAGVAQSGRFVRSGPPGMADISGILAPSGRRIECEVKISKDRVSAQQAAFLKMITDSGGIAVVARSEEQALRDIEGCL